MVKLLIEKGANVSVRGFLEFTPLILAAWTGIKFKYEHSPLSVE